MNILNKLLTALRGAANETGEAIIDTQAIRILDQEIRDAKEHLQSAKENLTEVIAEQKAVQRKVDNLKASISEHEQYAVQALEKNNEALALEIAQKIAELSNELDAQSVVLDSFNGNVATLRQTVAETERNIQGMDRELTLVKTTDSVQKANEAVAARFSGSRSSLRSATESLERIKAKQQKKADRIEAAHALRKEENGDNLREKLKDAGIIERKASGASVLAALKAKHRTV